MNAVVMHVGGNPHRVYTTRRVAERFRPIGLIVSAETQPRFVRDVLGLPAVLSLLEPIAFDYRPWDTVTHFTVIVDELVDAGVEVLHVVTDRFHLRRAVWVARIILFGTGIRVVGHAHDDPAYRKHRDPWLRLVKDVLRAIVKRATGHLIYDRRIRAARETTLAAAKAEWAAL